MRQPRLWHSGGFVHCEPVIDRSAWRAAQRLNGQNRLLACFDNGRRQCRLNRTERLQLNLIAQSAEAVDHRAGVQAVACVAIGWTLDPDFPSVQARPIQAHTVKVPVAFKNALNVHG